jgi:hypothetical protein
MKVLMDEGVPRGLRQILTAHQVKTLQDLGWGGVRITKLLASAESAGFDVLLTTDISMVLRPQTKLALAIVKLPTNELRALTAMSAQILSTIDRAQPGNVYEIPSDKWEGKH